MGSMTMVFGVLGFYLSEKFYVSTLSEKLFWLRKDEKDIEYLKQTDTSLPFNQVRIADKFE